MNLHPVRRCFLVSISIKCRNRCRRCSRRPSTPASPRASTPSPNPPASTRPPSPRTPAPTQLQAALLQPPEGTPRRQGHQLRLRRQVQHPQQPARPAPRQLRPRQRLHAQHREETRLQLRPPQAGHLRHRQRVREPRAWQIRPGHGQRQQDLLQHPLQVRGPHAAPRQRTSAPTQTVGPGQYEAPKMLNSTGNYFNSRFKNSGCGKIGNAARFEDERTLPPGPGKYRDRLGMNRTGTYFNTRVQSNFVMTFQGTVRPPINAHNDVPGPGS